MKLLLSSSLALLLFAPVPRGGPEATSRWVRTVTPNAKEPMAVQCVVLDADVFAHAGPGLKDVRLLQDGQELPYAMDESHDDAGEAAGDDRAFYETSLVIDAVPGGWSAAPHGVAEERPEGMAHGEGELPAHVPVERVSVEGAGDGGFLAMSAAPLHDPVHRETLETDVHAKHPSVLFTVGANLQENADVGVTLNGGARTVKRFVLQMRRREICYQPLSASPVRMLYGDEKAEARHYAFARTFRPVAVPVLAMLGAREANPEFVVPAPVVVVTRLQKLVVGWMAGLTLLVLLAAPLLRVRRRG